MMTSHCGDTSRSRRIVPLGPLPVQYPISSCPLLTPVDGAAATSGGGANRGAAAGVAVVAVRRNAGQGVAAACKIFASGKLYGPVAAVVYQPMRATSARCQAAL